MKCPDCVLPLITVEIDGVELDYCVDGHGEWLDEGELEAMMRSEEPVVHFEGKGVASARRCPRCNKPLNIHMTAQGLELDVCRWGDGVWFDRGELNSLADELRSVAAPEELGYLETALQRLGKILEQGDPK